MSKYTVEAVADYPGVREFGVGSELSAGVYIESLIPHTPLPYKLREITRRTPDVDPGHILDAQFKLSESHVLIVPTLDPQAMQALILKAMVKNPISPDFAEQMATLILPHGHIRRERGLKLLLPQVEREYTVRLHPPEPVSRVFLSRPNPWR